MSDSPPGYGWWKAGDGRWYPPEQHPEYVAPGAPPTSTGLAPQHKRLIPAVMTLGFVLMFGGLFLPWETLGGASTSGFGSRVSGRVIIAAVAGAALSASMLSGSLSRIRLGAGFVFAAFAGAVLGVQMAEIGEFGEGLQLSMIGGVLAGIASFVGLVKT